MRQITRLTESDLHRIVKESVKRMLKESSEDLWQELRDAKAYGASTEEIIDIIHRLEASLKEEGKLNCFDIPKYKGGGKMYTTATKRPKFRNPKEPEV